MWHLASDAAGPGVPTLDRPYTLCSIVIGAQATSEQVAEALMGAPGPVVMVSWEPVIPQGNGRGAAEHATRGDYKARRWRVLKSACIQAQKVELWSSSPPGLAAIVGPSDQLYGMSAKTYDLRHSHTLVVVERSTTDGSQLVMKGGLLFCEGNRMGLNGGALHWPDDLVKAVHYQATALVPSAVCN